MLERKTSNTIRGLPRLSKAGIVTPVERLWAWCAK